MRDEGRPLGIGWQDLVSNHLKLLRLRAVVVNVEGKDAAKTAPGANRKDEQR